MVSPVVLHNAIAVHHLARQLRLGAAGDHYLEARTHRLGEYRYRQYEICHTDATDFVLVEAQEDVEMA